MKNNYYYFKLNINFKVINLFRINKNNFSFLKIIKLNKIK